MSLAWWDAIRSHARYAVVLSGVVVVDCVSERNTGAMVASALVDDAGVMSDLGPMPLGRWQSTTEER